MKKRIGLLCAVAGLLSISQPLLAQTSVKELVMQANELMKKGNADNAEKAIRLYNRAKAIDSNVRKACDDNIKKCQRIISKERHVELQLSTDEVTIPYQGGDYQVGIISSKSWKVDGLQKWINTESYDKNSFILQCREQNNSTRERVSNLMVKSGNLYKSLKVTQAARPEYIEVDATNLSFPSSGTTEQIGVESNARWDVTSVPSWCKVEKGDSTIRIIVAPNDRVMERVDDIVIVSPNKSVTIKIYQGAGEERLTLSQNNIILPGEGGKHYMKVYTDANNWFVGDFPSWLNVQRIGNDSICIESGKNEPNGQERSGSVQVRTDRQTIGVMVTQAAREPVDVIWTGAHIVGGRNFSIGVSASYLMPFISSSAGGSHVGSVVDYSLGNSSENASYRSASGFSVGAFADMRLYKNIFLMAGVNFTQMKYKNEFNLSTVYSTPYNGYQYTKGEVTNAYQEDYTHTMIEVPILASYRFKLKSVSHVQLNVGPVLNFGLSSKMKLNGNTDSETLRLYDRYTDSESNSAYYGLHMTTDADFNLYQPCVLWEQSSSADGVISITHHDKFTDSPLHRFNCGLRVGAAYEVSGLSFGLYYTMMLTNMANKNYWENKRFAILNESNTVMGGYKQHINTLEFKLAYTLRYLGQKK